MINKNNVINSILALSLSVLSASHGFAGERIVDTIGNIDIELETVEWSQLAQNNPTATTLPGVVENQDTKARIVLGCDTMSAESKCTEYSFYLVASSGSAPTKLNQKAVTPEQLSQLMSEEKQHIKAKKVPFFNFTKWIYGTQGFGGTLFGTTVLGGVAGVFGFIIAAHAPGGIAAGALVLGAAFVPAAATVASPVILDIAKAPFVYSYVLVDKWVKQGKENRRAKLVGRLVRVLASDEASPFTTVSDKEFQRLEASLRSL